MSDETQIADALLPLTEASSLLPRRSGREVSLATIRRWAAKGQGGARLQVQRVGGRYYTRPSWVEAFIAQCNPPAAELDPGVFRSTVRPIDTRKAAKARQLLAAGGRLGAKEKAQVFDVRSISKASRAV